MPILLILLLTLACLPESWPRPAAWISSPAQSILLTWAAVGLLVSFAYLLVGRINHYVEKQTLPRAQILRRYFRGRKLHLAGMLCLFFLALYGLGYGWALHQLWASRNGLLPGVDLLLLAPFLVTLLFSWAAFYSAEKALSFLREPDEDQPRRGRWAYVFFHARQNLALVLLPIVLLLIEKELRRQIPGWAGTWEKYGSFFGVGFALCIFILMPYLLRLVLGLQPLPAGSLRARLESTSQRLGFRCSNILVWKTQRGVANAMVVGAFPFLRYVLLSDRLIEDLSEEEVEAVFGHEVGHIKHNHMLFYLGFLLTSITAFTLIMNPYLPQLARWLNLEGRQDLAALPIVSMLGAYIFLVFGFLSRRCERQADIYGCRAVSCSETFCLGHEEGTSLAPRGRGLCATGIRTFCSALEKVGIINGISRDNPGFFQSWQHSTIARRVEFLQSLALDPQRESRFQLRVLLLKCGLFAVLAGVMLYEMF